MGREEQEKLETENIKEKAKDKNSKAGEIFAKYFSKSVTSIIITVIVIAVIVVVLTKVFKKEEMVQGMFLEDVISRKKQILPGIMLEMEGK